MHYLFGHPRHQYSSLPRAALVQAVRCPRHQYSSLPQAALVQAVRCCTDVSSFANELEDMPLLFEYNGFEEDFFIVKLQLFLEEFDTVQLEELHYGEAYYDQSLYDYLRQNVFNYNQGQKKVLLKRLQRQTISYRWKRSLN
ncbi:unnamed protein product [Didymodactylos carnosus]|uniref:Helix-turn-helix domain-containing protein n=1 Tax=Didymodactylos carnosus TaxID=1234261 RepID=A0A815FEG6_9BILA|nr:unnamed protein product [Didymodactylos carnosus]CAF1322388.1 unnamed protein product [Didymodactylos carnosus]CAF3878272.1 unnamed protein product [Didymodactylos carnosus]CAF4169347.1 unnamed protein product [Didymodactylos carnosus]